jgi:hypothetical protein
VSDKIGRISREKLIFSAALVAAAVMRKKKTNAAGVAAGVCKECVFSVVADPSVGCAGDANPRLWAAGVVKSVINPDRNIENKLAGPGGAAITVLHHAWVGKSPNHSAGSSVCV